MNVGFISWRVNNDRFPTVGGDMVKTLALSKFGISGTKLPTKIGRVADAVTHFASIAYGRTNSKHIVDFQPSL